MYPLTTKDKGINRLGKSQGLDENQQFFYYQTLRVNWPKVI